MNVKYQQMSEAERLAWGREESRVRKEELAVVKSEAALKQAQANAEARRKLIGASRGQAADMVIVANRADRVAEWRAEQNSTSGSPTQ